MAAPMGNVRVKLDFKINTFLSNNIPSKCWLLVNTNNLHSVSDLEKEIRIRFDVDESVGFQLFLDDCFLPAWESLQILRDNDIICICGCPAVKKEKTAQSDSPCRVQCQSEECENAVSENLIQTMSGAGGGKVNPSVEIAYNSQQEFPTKNKKKKKKRKRNRESDDEENAVDNADHSTQRETPANGGDEERNRECSVDLINNQKQQIDSRDEKKIQKKTKKSRRCMDSDNEVGTLHTSVKGQSDDPDVDISPLRQIVPESLTVSDGTSRPCSNVHQENQLSIGFDAVLQMHTGDNTTSSDIHIPSEINQSSPGKYEEIVQEDNNSMASFSDQPSGDKSKKKRKRRRGNKSKLVESKSDSVNSWNSTDVINKIARFPNTSAGNARLDLTAASAQTKPGHFFFNSDSENDNVLNPAERLDDNTCLIPTSVKREESVQKPSENHEQDSSLNKCDVLISEQRRDCAQGVGDVSRIVQLPRDPSQNLSAGKKKSTGIFANIPVFQRQKFKKTPFYPLSKEEQLGTVATNVSSIYKNEDPPETPEVAKRDFTSFPILQGPPRQGDHIAYKILEMDNHYSPVISNYKEAKVLSYNPVTQSIELDLLHAIQKKTAGRFDIRVEDDTEVLTNTEEASSTILLTWTSLLDTRLVTD